ncbi:TauD/TfdA dioxygenase family protein [Streptomyces lavendulae]|uniref:Alpha-ketoglutarate-dependent sulfate ester dioxygenase n=1 Tax=Streptomyces lavendulae subsp. lavendulae TaxID=58340 RepID=A0A2K8PB13_STRLA|nr:TauD/TfdA family dioxygenase [Streptomyces lavendulae]ATZ23929.1 putative dioxygenase [Streptomyces lavendulae subsp. lavendulae]QUQ53760.1 Alpha-ketoglutarate-dependent sulfate ester dioxygenase [Streptomyces lavendulae subsp. lavendulae]
MTTLTATTATTVTQLGGRIGAEIGGVRLGGDLAPEAVAEIRTALLAHKVVFFRGQDHLDEAGHEAFAQLLGTPVAHPTVPSADGRYALGIDSHHGARANQWHTDVTFVPAYPAFSILRAVTIPPYGGNTLWANTATAYTHLPEPLRALADGLRAVHSNEYDYAALKPDALPEALAQYREVFTSTKFLTEHPVVRVHPETGERTLLLGNFVQRINGLTGRDSRTLLDLFQAHIESPENTVRWQWRAGDVAIWDNRATQHYGVDDSDDHERTLRRVTVDGDVPVGPDGLPSRLISPEAVPAPSFGIPSGASNGSADAEAEADAASAASAAPASA